MIRNNFLARQEQARRASEELTVLTTAAVMRREAARRAWYAGTGPYPGPRWTEETR